MSKRITKSRPKMRTRIHNNRGTEVIKSVRHTGGAEDQNYREQQPACTEQMKLSTNSLDIFLRKESISSGSW